jgi:hypothetical protein
VRVFKPSTGGVAAADDSDLRLPQAAGITFDKQRGRRGFDAP